MARKSNTRAANGLGNIRQRPNGSWEGRICIGRDPGTGKLIRQSVYGKTQKEVRKKLVEIQQQVDSGSYQAPNKITVTQWFNEWMKTYHSVGIRPSTNYNCESILKNHIIPYIGAMKMQDVQGVHIQRIINDLVKQNYKNSTIRTFISTARASFQCALLQEIIPFNPFDRVTMPKVEAREIVPLSDDSINYFLDSLQGERLRNAYAVCLLAGLRKGECLALSWPDIDFAGGTITIEKQLQKVYHGKGFHIVYYTKTVKKRTVVPPAITFTYLLDEQNRQKQAAAENPTLWNNEHDLVFTNDTGGHISPVVFYRNFKRIARSINIPDARPHDLRHTAATVAISSGADIKSVQELLGHSKPTTTLNVYVHGSSKSKIESASKMNSYFSSIVEHDDDK